MRFCASPILFTHRSQRWQSNNILACVDLESADAQHIRLNNGIIRDAKAMSETLGMELYIDAAYDNNINNSLLQNESNISDKSAAGLAEIFGVEVGNMILRQGHTVETIHDICVEIEPSIIVIGSIARTGVSAKLIGNTAEKLLDIVDADILTIN
jgi:universal stress protein E